LDHTTGVQVVNLPTQIPQAISKILNCTDALDAANELRNLVNAVDPTTVDAESKYSNEKQYQNNWAKVTTWASGGGILQLFREPIPNSGRHYVYRFNRAENTSFFENLFRAVKNNSPATCGRNNLFHGHAVFDPNHNDLRIVFHAFEYPTNLSDTEEMSSRANQLEPSTQSFNTFEKSFYKRNAICSLKSECLFILDCYGLILGDDVADRHYYAWIDLPGVRLDQERIGYELVTFNYFPKELERGQALFLKA
jgi:hypothetical protein